MPFLRNRRNTGMLNELDILKSNGEVESVAYLDSFGEAFPVQRKRFDRSALNKAIPQSSN